MKKTIILLLIFLSLNCFASSKTDSIENAVRFQLDCYPELRLADLYKSFFQDRFGPGHIAPTRQSAQAYIQRELSEADGYNCPYYEPAGRGDNFFRVSLQVISDSIVPFNDFFEAFYNSIVEVTPVDVQQWKKEWIEILQIIKSMNLEIQDFESDESQINALLDSNQYAFHHSRIYNDKYNPHYRLIKRDIFETELKPGIDKTVKERDAKR